MRLPARYRAWEPCWPNIRVGLSTPRPSMKKPRRGCQKPCIDRASEPPARPVSGSGLHSIFLSHVREYFNRNFAETLVGVRLRIIRHRIGIAQIFADGLERLHLLLPGLGEIRLAAGAV